MAGQMRCYKSGLVVIVIDRWDVSQGRFSGMSIQEDTLGADCSFGCFGSPPEELVEVGRERSVCASLLLLFSQPRPGQMAGRQDETQYLECQCVCLCLWTNSLHMSVLPHFPTQTQDFNLLLLSGTVLHINHGSS